MLPIEIFTDGSSRGNPGPGGYGVILRCGEHYKELSGGFAETTNNRMELTAVIVGLEAVRRPNAEIILYSDSRSRLSCTVTRGMWWTQSTRAGSSAGSASGSRNVSMPISGFAFWRSTAVTASVSSG